jgi:hypothetical protein
MDFDNDRDRFSFGHDVGIIIDGKVTYDSATDEYVLVDEDGKALSVQTILKQSIGRQVRLTFIPLESMQKLQDLLLTHPGD